MDVTEELLPAQNKSYELGRKLGLPVHDVEAIHSTYSEPSKRLLHVVIAALERLQPPPTWRTIVDALKSPLVNLPKLAETVEAKHFPVVSSSQDSPQSDTTISASG